MFIYLSVDGHFWFGAIINKVVNSHIQFFFFNIILFIFGCAGSSLLHGGSCLVAVRRLLTVEASLVAEHRL